MSETIREPDLFIDGTWRAGSGPDLEVEDPATEQVTGVVTQAGPDDVEAAVDAARRAFPSWSATPPAERAAAIRRLHAILSGRASALAGLITREQGSPPRLARGLHVDVPLGVTAATADALDEFAFRSELGNSLILREPVGVVAAITPWNLPLHQVIVKVVPALAAGTTVVLKPAGLTPLSAFALARAIDEAGFPPGVFNLVPGSGRVVGDALCRHHDVDQISFTGSTPVGRRVAEAAAATLKRTTLELGGKSASVVLADTDEDLLGKAVRMTVANCFLNGGQTCTALSRLIVPAQRRDEVERLAEAAAAKYTLGDRLGPLISAEQRKEVAAFLAPDRTGGARAVVGGDPEAPVPATGHWVTPTVYSGVDPHAPIAREEIFGPVLSILTADDDAHALALANDSDFGLGGAVWSSSEDAALEAAAALRTGQVDVNGAAFNPRAPFGGYKQSGLGREIGDHGIADVCEIKAVQR